MTGSAGEIFTLVWMITSLVCLKYSSRFVSFISLLNFIPQVRLQHTKTKQFFLQKNIFDRSQTSTLTAHLQFLGFYLFLGCDPQINYEIYPYIYVKQIKLSQRKAIIDQVSKIIQMIIYQYDIMNHIVKILLNQLIRLIMDKEKFQEFAQRGQDSLRSDLDIDEIRGNYIQHKFLQLVYKKMLEISNSLFNFVIIYFTSTGQVVDFDPISYIRQTKHKHYFIIICFLTLYWFLAKKFLWDPSFQLIQEETEKQIERKQKEQIQNKKEQQHETNTNDQIGGLYNTKATPSEMRLIDLTVDLTRVVDTGLVYLVLEQDIFRVTVDEHVKIIDYLLILMWILYSGRHLIFWVDNWNQQKIYRLNYWSAKSRIPDYLKKIQTLNMRKAQDLKKGVQNYENYLKIKDKIDKINGKKNKQNDSTKQKKE